MAPPDPSSPSQPLPPAPPSRLLPFHEPYGGQQEEPYYLPPRILAAIQREAAARDANGDWATYAQQKLDRELRTCSLLLTDDQVLMLHRYAAVLGADPQDVLATLLAPSAARRERLWRRANALGRACASRQQRPRGCLVLVVWPAALVGLWAIAQWGASLLPLLIHR